jgi:transcriptional regulator with XRE-family HTH domain
MTFGEKLRQVRDEKGLTREQLAAASGVSFGTIHGYEIGRRAPSLANAVRLAAALGITCLDFAGCSDVAPTGPNRKGKKK